MLGRTPNRPNYRGGSACENNVPPFKSGTMVGQGQFSIYLPRRVDGEHYVRTPVKVKAEMILSPERLGDGNLGTIMIPCRARAEKLFKDNVLSVINVPIKIEAELLLTPRMSFSCKSPTPRKHSEALESVAKPGEHDLRRQLPMSTEEKDVPTALTETPAEIDESKFAARFKISQAEGPSVTFKTRVPEDTSAPTLKSHNAGFPRPMKTNLKELSETSTNWQPQLQRTVVPKRREPMVCQREQIYSQRKAEREKQIKTPDESERKKNNQYLQQYLRRESFSKPTSVQDAEAVKRREILMKELGLKLKDELGMRQVHNAERTSQAFRT